jgi:hypothetical protein
MFSAHLISRVPSALVLYLEETETSEDAGATEAYADEVLLYVGLFIMNSLFSAYLISKVLSAFLGPLWTCLIGAKGLIVLTGVVIGLSLFNGSFTGASSPFISS